MNALKVEGEKGRAFEINPKNPLQKRYEISARSVARVLSEHGITLKKNEETILASEPRGKKSWRWRIENFFKDFEFLGLNALPSIGLL